MTLPLPSWLLPNERAVVEQLMHDDKQVYLSILGLYERQARSERISAKTFYKNNVGFNIADAHIYTPMALQILAHGQLSHASLKRCRRRTPRGLPHLGRYRKQIEHIVSTRSLDGLMRQLRAEVYGPEIEPQMAA